MPTTTKWGLRSPTSTDVPDVPTDMTELATDVEAALPLSGTLASIPTPAAGRIGATYYATDTKQNFFWTGSAWVDGLAMSGRFALATQEQRLSTTYGYLPTPDRVQGVVVPADAMVLVSYEALWQEAVAGAARAALFIGGNQLKVRLDNLP